MHYITRSVVRGKETIDQELLFDSILYHLKSRQISGEATAIGANTVLFVMCTSRDLSSSLDKGFVLLKRSVRLATLLKPHDAVPWNACQKLHLKEISPTLTQTPEEPPHYPLLRHKICAFIEDYSPRSRPEDENWSSMPDPGF